MDQCDQKQLFDRLFCVEQFKDRDDKTSKTISREKGQRIVNVIKKDPSAVTSEIICNLQLTIQILGKEKNALN